MSKKYGLSVVVGLIVTNPSPFSFSRVWQKACIDAGRRVNIILAAVFVLALRAAGRKGDDVRPAKRVLLR